MLNLRYSAGNRTKRSRIDRIVSVGTSSGRGTRTKTQNEEVAILHSHTRSASDQLPERVMFPQHPKTGIRKRLYFENRRQSRILHRRGSRHRQRSRGRPLLSLKRPTTRHHQHHRKTHPMGKVIGIGTSWKSSGNQRKCTSPMRLAGPYRTITAKISCCHANGTPPVLFQSM